MPPAILIPSRSIGLGQRLRSHLAILRLDHSIKQLFVLPGVFVAFVMARADWNTAVLVRLVLGLVAVTLVASSNYVLNEMLDAPFDRLHPTKCARPAVLGLIHYPAGYTQWLVLAIAGILLAGTVSAEFLPSVLALWLMGCVYNIPPLRLKDLPYLDVLAESVNNPLRFCAGWYIVTPTIPPPLSLLISYWMLGAYFMALKRFSEYRQIGPECAASYRRSFRHYTEKALLNSVVFYAATSMLFFGAFIMRYRLEWVLAFPVIALLMAEYFNLSFQSESAVQNPEKLFRAKRLMVLVCVCVGLLALLLFVNVSAVGRLFPPSGISCYRCR